MCVQGIRMRESDVAGSLRCTDARLLCAQVFHRAPGVATRLFRARDFLGEVVPRLRWAGNAGVMNAGEWDVPCR